MAGIIIDNTRLDESVEQGSTFRIKFLTAIIATVGGRESAVRRWVYPRHEYDISYGIQSADDLYGVQEFYYARNGQAFGFKFKDWNDYEADNDIGVGDGAETTFQLYKTYTDTVRPYNRRITHPVVGTVVVVVNGVTKVETTDYTVNYTTGVITFGVGDIPGVGHVVHASFEFDVPVRFADDTLDTDVIWEDAKSLPAIKLIEVRGNV